MTYQYQSEGPCRDCGEKVYFDSSSKFPLDANGLQHYCRKYRVKRETRKITEHKSDGGIVVIEETIETPIIERRLIGDKEFDR